VVTRYDAHFTVVACESFSFASGSFFAAASPRPPETPGPLGAAIFSFSFMRSACAEKSTGSTSTRQSILPVRPSVRPGAQSYRGERSTNVSLNVSTANCSWICRALKRVFDTKRVSMATKTAAIAKATRTSVREKPADRLAAARRTVFLALPPVNTMAPAKHSAWPQNATIDRHAPATARWARQRPAAAGLRWSINPSVDW
jgi:hypothetical protein